MPFLFTKKFSTFEDKTKEMTDKQVRFCEEYLIDLNATQASIRAGYSEDTAASIGCENLTKPDIQNYIANLMAKQQERTNITADRVLKQAARITFSDIRDYYNPDGTFKNVHTLSDDAAAALAAIDTDELFEYENGEKVFIGYSKKIKLYDKLAGIEKLMKHLGLYKSDNEQSKPEINIPPIVNIYNSGPALAGSETEIDDRV